MSDDIVARLRTAADPGDWKMRPYVAALREAADEIERLHRMYPLYPRVKELEAEIERLRARIKELEATRVTYDPDALARFQRENRQGENVDTDR